MGRYRLCYDACGVISVWFRVVVFGNFSEDALFWKISLVSKNDCVFFVNECCREKNVFRIYLVCFSSDVLVIEFSFFLEFFCYLGSKMLFIELYLFTFFF